MRQAVPFVAGLLFALGLGISGMTAPAKVIAFLDVFGRWDPSLAFVMAGALVIHLPFVQWWRRRRPSAVATAPQGDVDAALLLGAALFGVGWGVSGYCPGPSFVSLASGATPVYVFVGAAFVGMALARRTSEPIRPAGPIGR